MLLTNDKSQNAHPAAPPAPTRIVVLGGGFGGAHAARHLERLFRNRPDVEIVLVSRDNFFLVTPLLFEVCSDELEVRHCSQPIRAFLRRARFIEATVQHVDLDRRVVHASSAEGERYELAYDQLVLALGAATNQRLIPGSEIAFTFKTVADALTLRNHVIERFERADTESDPDRKRRLVTFVVIGGGLVGTELTGELTVLVDEILRYYPRVRREEVQFHIIEAGERILPEMRADLASYAARVLRGRGVNVHVATPVQSVEPGRLHLAAETIEAETIVLAAGIVPSGVVAGLDVEKDKSGRMVVDATMRCPSRPELWALGDAARIPGPDGKPYPALAQHALREAKTVARNIHAVLHGGAPEPFVYETLGTMASLGHYRAIGVIAGVPLKGFPAWWAWRSYYLMQMPRWSRRVRIMIDWTVALFFRPDITKVDLAVEQMLHRRNCAAGAAEGRRSALGPRLSAEAFVRNTPA